MAVVRLSFAKNIEELVVWFRHRLESIHNNVAGASGGFDIQRLWQYYDKNLTSPDAQLIWGLWA